MSNEELTGYFVPLFTSVRISGNGEKRKLRYDSVLGREYFGSYMMDWMLVIDDTVLENLDSGKCWPYIRLESLR